MGWGPRNPSPRKVGRKVAGRMSCPRQAGRHNKNNKVPGPKKEGPKEGRAWEGQVGMEKVR